MPHQIPRNRQQGIALIAVLWVVAALGLMVTGLIHVVKGETRITSQLQRTALDTGIADGAIRLALQQSLQAGKKEFRSIQAAQFQLFDRQVQVEIVPLNGLINLNKADTALLTAAFQHAGQLPQDQANALAQAVDQERKRPNAKGEASQLHAVEDLMRLPQMNFDTYNRVKDVFSVDLENTDKVNPLAAPLGVLRILAQGQDSLALSVLQARQQGGETTDTTQLNGQFVGNNGTSSLLVRAIVGSGDNTAIVRAWRVVLGSDSRGLPWRVIGKDAPSQITRPPIS